ncbi:MAG: copper chaperone PCu(A)C [Alphaproteobacteria bacterium]|nr:copper chaperone PCu(A)C [Alphaproteobacteria bacterium]
MIKRRHLLALAVALTAAPFAFAQSRPSVQVEQAWARATAGQMRTGAAYMTLVNTGTEPDRLIAVATPAADKAELHTHVMEGDVMRMRALTAVEVNPGSPSVLKPGGLHVMLMGLKAPLKAGDSFALALTFEKAGRIETTVKVGAAGASGPGASDGHGAHQHKGHGS